MQLSVVGGQVQTISIVSLQVCKSAFRDVERPAATLSGLLSSDESKDTQSSTSIQIWLDEEMPWNPGIADTRKVPAVQRPWTIVHVSGCRTCIGVGNAVDASGSVTEHCRR